MAPAFLPGMELARRYHAEVVRPLLDQESPGLTYSAALLGWGSEVLGFDSPRSTDHNWGPRLQVFLADAAADRAAEISGLLARRLPVTFLGFRTAFPESQAAEEGDRHWVEVTGLGRWLVSELGFDPRAGVTAADWLAVPTQRLAEVTGGAVFHDGLAAGDLGGSGGLGAARAALAWYPRDIWLYLLACQWQRISQEEAFPGRCAEAADDLGAALVTARLARDLIRLVLLMQRRYPPYSKWLGTAFARLPAAAPLVPLLSGAIAAPSWPERERNLRAAYQAAARMHNELGITAPVDAGTRQYYDRPYYVLDAGRFCDALRSAIADPVIRALPPIGAVDQFIDSTDATGDLGLLRAAVAVLFRRGQDGNGPGGRGQDGDGPGGRGEGRPEGG